MFKPVLKEEPLSAGRSCAQGAFARSAWQPPGGDAADPGWMAPLVVLARAYSAFLSTFGDDYMYRLQVCRTLCQCLPIVFANRNGSSGSGDHCCCTLFVMEYNDTLDTPV